MVVSSVSTRSAIKDISGVWVSLDTLGVSSFFSYGDAYFQFMTDVGSSGDFGVLPATED